MCVVPEDPYRICLALCSADCQYFVVRVVTPYSLRCDKATGWTAKELFRFPTVERDFF
jgi:hypothetical protein